MTWEESLSHYLLISQAQPYVQNVTQDFSLVKTPWIYESIQEIKSEIHSVAIDSLFGIWLLEA